MTLKKTVAVFVTSFSLAFQLPLAPAMAGNNDARNLLLGIGAAIILNGARKGQKSSGGSSGQNFSGVSNQAIQTQQFLNDLGYDAGPVDGQHGKRTKTAIAQFQRDRGYQPTGRLSKTQFAALQSNREAVVSPSKTGEVTRATTYEAQVYLSELGFDTGTPDGVWGPRSQAALNSFRVSTGIPQSGMRLEPSDIQNLHMQVHQAPLQMAGAGLLQQPADGLMKTGAESGNANSNNAGFGSGGLLQVGSNAGGFGNGSALDSGSGSLTQSVSPLDPSAYVHLAARPVEGAVDISRDLSIQILKARPELLEDFSVVEQWFGVDHPRPPFGKTGSDLRAAYDSGNAIEKENALLAFRDALKSEMENSTVVSPDDPLPVALYQPITFGDYVDGKGLKLAGVASEKLVWQFRTRYMHPSTMLLAELPKAGHIAISREQAREFIDTQQLRKNAMFRVVWGQITSVGSDDKVASFAKTESALSQFQVPASFSVDRVAVALAEPGYKQQPRINEILHEFKLLDRESPAHTGQDIYTYLKGLDMPTMNEHVLIPAGNSAYYSIPGFSGQDLKRQKAVYQRLAYMLWLGQHPEFAENGHSFVSIAANLFTEEEKRQFFGAGAQQLHYVVNPSQAFTDVAQVNTVMQIGGQIFKDEFAAQDAKKVFLKDFYPKILADIPSGTLPVMQIMSVQLGSYDFEGGAFPLIYDGGQDMSNKHFRVAQLPTNNQGYRQSGLMSADRLRPFPDKLVVSPEQARSLRDAMGASTQIYLVWTSEFSPLQNGSEIENALTANYNPESTMLQPGRATLTQMGLFLDSGLNTLIREYDVSKMAVSVDEVMAEAAAAITQIDRIKLVENIALVKTASEMLDDPAIDLKIAKTHFSVAQANEFNEEEALDAALLEWQELQTQPIWLTWAGTLGRYDKATQKFPVLQPSQQQKIQIAKGSSNFRSYASIQLLGDKMFVPIDVPEATARTIVEGGGRNITLYILAEASKARLIDPAQASFELVLEPKQVIYTSTYTGTGKLEVIASRDLSAQPSYFEETFETRDFAHLAQRQPINLGTLALLNAKSMSEAELDADLRNLMVEILYSERKDRTDSSDKYFENDIYEISATTFEEQKVRFKSWIAARTKALGSDFVVDFRSNASWRGQCGRVSVFDPEADILNQQGIDTSQMLLDARILRETSAAAIVSKPAGRAHIFYTGRPLGSRNACELTAMFTTISLEGIGVLKAENSGQPATYPYQAVDFTMTGLKRSTINNDGIWLNISTKVTETRFYTKNPQAGSSVTPDITIENASSRTVASGEASVETVKFSNSKVVEPFVEPSTSVWPVIDELDYSGAKNDTVGIQLGDTMSDVDIIVNKDFDVTMTYQTKIPSERSLPGLDYMRVYVIDGGTQVVSVTSYSPDGPVTSISRQLFRANNPWPQEQISASLVEKYGETSLRASDDSTMLWSENVECSQLPLSASGTRQFFPIGDDIINGELNTNLAIQALGGIATIARGNEDFLKDNSSCGSFVRYSSEPLSPIHGYHGLYTYMVDLSLLQTIQEILVPVIPKVAIKF